MSIDYGKFRFASAPRTGTTWFLQACDSAGVGKGYKSHAHLPFVENDRHAFKLSMVRHPYYWLESYFKSILPGSTGISEVDKLHFDFDNPPAPSRSKDFLRFVDTYLSVCPGQVGRIFSSYGADSYLRTEDLPWGLVEFLESLGYPQYQRNRCKYVDPANCSKHHFPVDKVAYRQVLKAEKEMCEIYDYY